MLVFKNGVPKEWHNPLLQVYSRAPMGNFGSKIRVCIDTNYDTTFCMSPEHTLDELLATLPYFAGTVVFDSTSYETDVLQGLFAHELGHISFVDFISTPNKKQKEFTADAFACSIGYGRGLLKYLERIKDQDEEGEEHPSPARRIANIKSAIRNYSYVHRNNSFPRRLHRNSVVADVFGSVLL